jgi:hypothetical protein
MAQRPGLGSTHQNELLRFIACHERGVRGVKVARKEQAAHGIRFSISGDDGEITLGRSTQFYETARGLKRLPFESDTYAKELDAGARDW